MEIIAWAYDAALHCPECAMARFGGKLHDSVDPPEDYDGNPVVPVSDWDEFDSPQSCDDCGGHVPALLTQDGIASVCEMVYRRYETGEGNSELLASWWDEYLSETTFAKWLAGHHPEAVLSAWLDGYPVDDFYPR